jgi:septum formation protein
MSLWVAAQQLLLASKSQARRALLEAAGIPIEIKPADIDERAIEARAGYEDAGTVAEMLAREKAKAVAALYPDRMVLGADQTLALGERRFSKASSRVEARKQLSALRGKTHVLHSAIVVVQAGVVVFDYVDSASLTMRPFSYGFLESYLDTVGDAAMASVGGYQIEGPGLQLFEKIEGEHSTILGLPLMPLLDWLRRAGHLAK